MFSHLRQTVESLAPQPRRATSDGVLEQHSTAALSRSSSIDSHSLPSLSSSQLAESAISSLRKSFASQRATSPANIPATTQPKHLPKSNLEERLRAKLAASDAQSTNTASTTSTIVVAESAVQSPFLVPLPDSPPLPPQADSIQISPPPLDLSAAVTEIHEQVDLASEVNLEDVTPLVVISEHNVVVSRPESPGEEIHSDVALIDTDSNVDALQARLKEVEHRFADVSAAFKRLQAEKDVADGVVRELRTGSSADVDELRRLLQDSQLLNKSLQTGNDDLSAKCHAHENQILELQKKHATELSSLQDENIKLKSDIAEAQSATHTARTAVSELDESKNKFKADLEQLQKELDKSRGVAQEEEEKRSKAISLLKAVRQKLVKAEKEKDDALKEISTLKEQRQGSRDRDEDEKNKIKTDLEAIIAERDRTILSIRAQTQQEISGLNERFDKETAALKSQAERSASTLQEAHQRELTMKNSQISALEQSLNSLARDKASFFDQLQLRQAETESLQSHLESLQSQNTELQYQLRESNERNALLKEDLAEAQREQAGSIQGTIHSAGDIARLLAASESKHEAKIAELKQVITHRDRERNDFEAEWSGKLHEKVREIEELKVALASASNTRQEEESVISNLNMEIEVLRQQLTQSQQQLSDLGLQKAMVKEDERAARAVQNDLSEKLTVLENLLDESKSRETQLRTHNRTLKEELRKVQSSAALLERQRNPGVGYWTARSPEVTPSDLPRASVSSDSSESARVRSPAPPPPKNEEEINFEYVRNVILQFLEHKEMRPNLVRVLATILRFTPQETRRLIAKA